jgi:mono/diheme cytochrome c family protein/plastocyanin
MVREWLARGFLVGFLAVIGLVVFGTLLRPKNAVILTARMPEAGGWTPENIMVQAGQPLNLRITSEDVVHSFAVGQTDWPVIDLFPGEVVETTLVFDEPGKYTFYCTRWCGVNHWRMRGVIEVVSDNTRPVEVISPLYQTLGIDLDAPRHAAEVPGERPSSSAGRVYFDRLPETFFDQDDYRATTPEDIYLELQREQSLRGLSDLDRWHIVAALWDLHTSPGSLALGRALYAENCAACHGEEGGGDGVFAAQMGAQDGNEHGHSPVTGHEIVSPTDFTDPGIMLSASPALLHGKILRGGMGTGMPYWGPIFSDHELWALVDYLWTFQFDQ